MKYPEQKINFTSPGAIDLLSRFKEKNKMRLPLSTVYKDTSPLREQQKFSKNKTYRLLQHYKYRNN